MSENQEQEQPDLAGYQSVNDLAKGYRASSDEAKRLKARAELLEQQNRELLSARPNVPQRGNPADTLTEYGIPLEPLEAIINDRVARGVAAAFEPIARGASARNSILSEYPDYQKFEADVARYVESDPDVSQKYQKMFGVDPEGAMEFAFLKFGEHKRRETPAAKSPQREARSEAQIPSDRRGDARKDPGSAQEEVLARSWEHFQKTGDPRAFAKARIRQVVSDEFLNR